MGICLHKEVLWTCMLSSVPRCLLYQLTWVIFSHIWGFNGAWIRVHVMDQGEIFAAVFTCMWRNVALLFKQSFSDSQTRREDSEKDAGSDAKIVVSSNSFCRASFCWLESLHLKCNYPDAEKRKEENRHSSYTRKEEISSDCPFAIKSGTFSTFSR